MKTTAILMPFPQYTILAHQICFPTHINSNYQGICSHIVFCSYFNADQKKVVQSPILGLKNTPECYWPL